MNPSSPPPGARGGLPSTPTHSCDGSEGSQVRRSPRCKDARTPYYLPLSEQPVNVCTPGSGRMVPDSCYPHPAARKGSRSASKRRAETPTDSFRCPPLPDRSQHAVKKPGASPSSAPGQLTAPEAGSPQQPKGGNASKRAGKRGAAVQQDQSLVICLSKSPENEVEPSWGRKKPRAESMSPSCLNATPSCSDSAAGGSQSTGGGRQRRATAAAAMLRIKGKMQPPSMQAQFGNLTNKDALAAVSAAVSAVHTKSQQASEGVKEDPSCATSGSAPQPCDTKPNVRATRNNTKQSPSTSRATTSRKRQQDAADSSACAEPDQKRLATQKDAVGGLKVEHTGGDGSSQRHKQRGSSTRKGVSGAAAAQPAKGRNAKALVQAVVKGSESASAAPPPAHGRAAVKVKQENARAAAAKGKLLPAAVPAMQTSTMHASSSAGLKRKPPKAPAPVEDMFPCGAEEWTDTEVARLQYVCTRKVPPSSLRYWQQVALHMPGRTITECYEKYNEKHAAPKRTGRATSAARSTATVSGKRQVDAEPKTECQKRKYVRQVRWQLQQEQQKDDPERLKELMRQQKAADACIDALRRKRPNTKPQPMVGTMAPVFPVFAGLDDDEPQGSSPPGHGTPKTPSKPHRQRVSELPGIDEALQVMKEAEEGLLESPEPDFYFSDGLSE